MEVFNMQCIYLLALSVSCTHGWDMTIFLESSFRDFQLGSEMTQEEKVENVKFFLFTKPDINEEKEMLFDNESSYKDFDPNIPTHVIIHGWRCPYNLMFDCKDVILSGNDYNVIVISWPSYNPQYFISKADTEIVGEHIAQFLDSLVEKKGLNLTNVNLVGHSLGAHTAGVVGNRVTKGKVGRITGLDPAGPGYSNGDTGIENTLSPDDAECVQVIHTNTDMLGIAEEIGTSDFFPNGGKEQLGCENDMMGICSHMKAITFYTEWMKGTEYIASECDSWEDYESGKCSENEKVKMAEDVGGECPEGNYYVKISGESPFKQIDIKNN